MGGIVRIMCTVRVTHKTNRKLKGTLRALVDKVLVNVPMPQSLVVKIDRWRYANKMPSRAAAIRTLIERGLEMGKLTPTEKDKT